MWSVDVIYYFEDTLNHYDVFTYTSVNRKDIESILFQNRSIWSNPDVEVLITDPADNCEVVSW